MMQSKTSPTPRCQAYMKSLVNGADAEKAYQGFLEFKDVVAANQVTTASAAATVPTGDKIGTAAKALSDASYPFIKDIDWLSDIYLKPLPGKTAPETLKAIDKMIVMGSKMDGNLLKAAAEAHHKAIGSIDAKGVTSPEDYEAVNAAWAVLWRRCQNKPSWMCTTQWQRLWTQAWPTTCSLRSTPWMHCRLPRAFTPSRMLWKLSSAKLRGRDAGTFVIFCIGHCFFNCIHWFAFWPEPASSWTEQAIQAR